MSETPTARVELTEDEREQLDTGSALFGWGTREDALSELVDVVESIVAARGAALTAERDELEHDLNNEAWANEKAKRDLDAARAEIERLRKELSDRG